MEFRFQFTISIISISVLLVFTGVVISTSLASQNNWDPRVYDPLCIQGKSTTVDDGFYNISFSISSNDNATINKILFNNPSPLNIQNQNTITVMVHLNGTELLKPLNMQSGDYIQANLLVPSVDLQPNSTYIIGTYATSLYHGLSWNTHFFFNSPTHEN